MLQSYRKEIYMSNKLCRANRALALLTLLVSLVTISAYAAPTDEEIHINEDGIPVQQYQAPDDGNDLHTVYWAKGTTPPKMSNTKSNYGKEGYFYREDNNGNLTFIHAFSFDQDPKAYKNSGFYDINKTNNLNPPEARLCYLASSDNLFHWWLDQNAKYITHYKEGIATGRYQQEQGLVGLENETNWENITDRTPLVKHSPNRGELMWGQTILSDPLAKNVLYPRYSSSTIGGWPDSLSAFFFNGYPSSPVDAIPKPDAFKPDQNGGYFHPIFGRTPLANRHVGSLSYEFYRDNIRQWLLEGKGIGLVYYPKGIAAAGASTHAITLWGAEYTSTGELYRVFISDSDDAYAYGKYDVKEGAQVSTAIYSLYAFEEHGKLYLSSGVYNGVRNKRDMDGIIELSLGQDIWEAVMNDSDPEAHTPDIVTQPQSRSYAIGAKTDPLTVEAEIPATDLGKGGYLTYQWYRAESKDGLGTPINGQTGSAFTPGISDIEETKYYYCEVTNHKYGKHAVKRTATAEISTVTGEIVNAKAPVFDSFSPSTVTCYVGDRPQIRVNARSLDNGKLAYQWFAKLDTMTNTLEEPLGDAQTSPTFIPPTDHEGTFKYYCKITNYSPDATGQRYASTEVTTHAVTVNVGKRPPMGTYTITFSTPGASTVAPITDVEGAPIQAPANPTRAGYHFVSWCSDPKLSQNVEVPETMPHGGLTLYAKWELDGPARGQEYEITDITVNDGRPITGNTLTAKVQIKNLTAAEIDQLVVAAYDTHGRQVGLTIQNIVNVPESLPPANESLQPITVTMETTSTAVSLKAFILSGTGSIPLSNSLQTP